MKKTLAVAKNELYFLFFSPIAWVMMILFMILVCSTYVGSTNMLVGAFERGGPELMFVQNLTDTILSNGQMAFLPKVASLVYLFFPLITMGLISREMNNGTIKLLYSSSLRIRQIVIGKYLAMLVFTLCLLALVGFMLIGMCVTIVNPDIEHIIASMFGIFLVLATCSAIGLFISSLTTYQIVAAMITLAFLGMLDGIGKVGQDIDIVRDVTFYLNIYGKSSNLINAFLNLRDVMYFVIFICSFLMFTMIRLKSSMQLISTRRKVLRYLSVIGVAVLLGYITSLPTVNVYYDATRFKLRTIAPATQEILAKLDDGELEVTAVANLMEHTFAYFRPSNQLGIEKVLWEPYIRFKPDIKFKFIYYYDADSTSYHYKLNPGMALADIAELQAASYGLDIERFLPPDEISKIANIREEEFRCFFILKYKGKSTILHTFDDGLFWPLEDEIAAAINRLIGTPPMVAFLSDEIERSPYSERKRDYKTLSSSVGTRTSLRNQGYDFDTLSLRRRDIPKDLTALVIADPRTPFTPEGLAKINRYIDEGGNLWICTEPDRKEIIKPILDKLGVSQRDGMLIQPSEEFASNAVFPAATDTLKHIAPELTRKANEMYKYWGDTVYRVCMSGASALEYQLKDGFTVAELMLTKADRSWNRTLPVNMDSVQLKMERHPSDENGSFLTGLRMGRKVNGRNQQIFVFGDADWLTKSEMYGGGYRRNSDISFWSFVQFSEGRFPAHTLRPESIDDAFTIKVDDIDYLKIVFYYIIPGLIGVIGSIFLIRRKRK